MPIADGRDLFRLIASQENEELWNPSMNLYELIQRIPDFIAVHHKREASPSMLGQFHLGFKYDMSTWKLSQHTPVYPC